MCRELKRQGLTKKIRSWAVKLGRRAGAKIKSRIVEKSEEHRARKSGIFR